MLQFIKQSRAEAPTFTIHRTRDNVRVGNLYRHPVKGWYLSVAPGVGEVSIFEMQEIVRYCDKFKDE